MFVSPSTCPATISDEFLEQIERFVVLLYSKTSEAIKVNESRQRVFAQSSRTIENIPPTQGALMQHLKRATYQAAYIWGQMLVAQPDIPSPFNWGWEDTKAGWAPKWTTLPQASKACYELIHCGCKKNLQGTLQMPKI